MVVSAMLANASPYRRKSEQRCFQKMSSCPIFMSVGDHGDPHGTRADFCSVWSRPLVISLSIESHREEMMLTRVSAWRLSKRLERSVILCAVKYACTSLR